MNKATQKAQKSQALSSKYIWMWGFHYGSHPIIKSMETGIEMPMTSTKLPPSKGYKIKSFHYGQFKSNAAPHWLKIKYAGKSGTYKPFKGSAWKALPAAFDAQFDEAFAKAK